MDYERGKPTYHTTNLLHRNERFVTIHNEFSKISPSKSLHLATRVNKIASCLSELIFMGSSIQNANERIVLCIRLSFLKHRSTSNTRNKNLMELVPEAHNSVAR